jgi:PKD repeat protein
MWMIGIGAIGGSAAPFSTPLTSSDQSDAVDPAIVAMCNEIDEAAIYQVTYDLQNFTTRKYPSTGNTRAATYIHDRLDAIPGLEVAYTEGEYRNIVATLPGKDTTADELVIVGAHYDSISRTPGIAPGATDNGCGVAIVLELARIMSARSYDRTVQFACWNAEETGLYGSEAYARAASNAGREIALYYNYDSGYYDPYDGYLLDIMSDTRSRTFSNRMTQLNSLYDLDFDLVYNTIYEEESDHRPFWDYEYPAVWTYCDLEAPEYHTKDDTVELVSLGYAKKSAKMGLALLAETARIRSVTVVPIGSATPRDLDGDGKYEDVNGNGRRDFADVTIYFSQMTWIGANEPLAAFDYNGNGRIDFADVTWLFNHL